MSVAAQTPDQIAAEEPRCRHLVNRELDISPRERSILNRVLDYSLKKGKEWAIFASFEHLGGLAGMDRPHASSCVSNLEDKGLLHCTRRRGLVRCRMLPDGVLVSPEIRLDPRTLAPFLDLAEELNRCPDGFDPDGQKLLALKTPEENLDDEQARHSRERAAQAGAGGNKLSELPGNPAPPAQTTTVPNRYGTGAQYQRGTNADRTELVRSQPCAYTRAPDHDHAPSSVPQSMVHAHGHARSFAEEEFDPALALLSEEELEDKLDDEARYFLSELEKMPGVSPRSFHKTWLLRLCDSWREVAIRAIAESKLQLAKGTVPKKGWGPYTNYTFKLWRRPQEKRETAGARSKGTS